MVPSRVQVIKEARIYPPNGWQLCFEWCCYVYDNGDPANWGYRFIWRREDGSLQAARGQARLPSFGEIKKLMDAAVAGGWADRDGDQMEAAVDRLEAAGLIVDRPSGYVGSPNAAASMLAGTAQQISDAQLIRDWS